MEGAGGWGEGDGGVGRVRWVVERRRVRRRVVVVIGFAWWVERWVDVAV